MAINVLIASRIYLLAEGISKLLEEAEDICLLGIVSCDKELEKMQGLDPDIIIADLELARSILANTLRKPICKILLIHDNSTLIGSFGDLPTLIANGLAGVLANNADGLMLRKALGAVAAGELWLDHKTIRKAICQQNGRKHDVQLTSREADVLECLCAGFSNREIAEKLFVSELTVKTHCNHLYKKFGVSSRIKLFLQASQRPYTSASLPSK